MTGLDSILDTGGLPEPSVSLRRAIVTSVDPLRIQFDGETAPVASSPSVLVPCGVGDRVMVAHHGSAGKRTQMLVLGVLHAEGRPWRHAVGQFQVIGTGATTAGASVYFPAGRFTATPEVFFTPHSSVYIAYRGGGTSSTAVGVGVRRFDGAAFSDTVTVSWHAIQMTPTSAGG